MRGEESCGEERKSNRWEGLGREEERGKDSSGEEKASIIREDLGKKYVRGRVCGEGKGEGNELILGYRERKGEGKREVLRFG